MREWTFNREDKRLYNPAGESRIPTSEEWRGFQLIDIQWKNRQQKLKQQQDAQKLRKQQQQKTQQQREQRLAQLQRDKRNLSQIDQSLENKDNDAKKQKTDEDMETEQPESTNTDWNSDAVRHSTIRVLADKDNQTLSQDDIQHLNRLLIRAAFKECKGDMTKYRQLQPDKMSLMQPYFTIRLRLPSKEGVEFWRNFIPTVPPRAEGGYKYRFLAPGENLTEKICFFLPDVGLADNKQEDLEMLEFCIKADNPKLEGVPIKLRCNGVESNTYKAVMIMDISTQDRQRCLGPKPANPADNPDWKIRVGLSTVKATVAFDRSAKLRRETAQARLNQDQATTSPKASTSKDMTPPKTMNPIEIDMTRVEIDKALDSDEDIDGIRQLHRTMIEDQIYEEDDKEEDKSTANKDK